jgi:hypothetical protein
MKQRWEGAWFEASPGKKLVKPFLKKQARHGSSCSPSHTGGIDSKIAA